MSSPVADFSHLKGWRRRSKLRGHEVDESAHLGGQVTCLRIYQPDRLDIRLEPVKNRNKLAAGNRCIDKIVLQLCQPITSAGGVADRRTVAEAHVTYGHERFFNSGLHK